MTFALIARDKPGALNIRLENRSTHLDYLAATKDKVAGAGPLLADDGETMIGSLIILNFDMKADAEAWAAADPYAKAGLFENVEIVQWKWVIGAPK